MFGLEQSWLDAVTELLAARLRDLDPPIGRTTSFEDLDVYLRGSVTDSGLGFDAAFEMLRDVVLANCVALDSPRFLAFIPAAPATAGKLADLVVSVFSPSAESWLEASGAVAAENTALADLAAAVGLPDGAGGCFVSGGSAGNLSGIAVARDATGTTAVAAADSAHSSVRSACHLLGIDVVSVATADGRLTAEALARAIGHRPEVKVVVASAGSTNSGAIDELAEVGRWCRSHGRWLHVDGAYGGALLYSARHRHRLDGIEHADSVIVDPHKWLFSPLDCCALLYRDPALALATHRQSASYLEPLTGHGGWNPSDYAFHLTRRARGLPLWFTLAVHGRAAIGAAIDRVLELTVEAAELVRAEPQLELLNDPVLSVLLFRRPGWDPPQWLQWSRQLLDDGVAFVVPSRWHDGEMVGRLVFLHPHTSLDVVGEVLAATR